MKIVTLGPALGKSEPKGTFCLEAASQREKNKKQPENTYIVRNTVWAIFESVENNEADEGVVPIENSVSGTIGSTLDALMEFDLNIIAEIILPVKHNLAGNGEIADIRTLYAHPSTYEQCEQFIRKNLPDINVIHTSSNAVSAQMIAEQDDKTKAAILPKSAIEACGLTLIKQGIQDNKFNVTRFVVISKRQAEQSERERTSIAIYPQVDKPGLLYNLLGEFAKRKINLTKIESRPSKGRLGDYIFFIDIQGSKEEQRLKDAFTAIEENFFLKVFGSYPREY